MQLRMAARRCVDAMQTQSCASSMWRSHEIVLCCWQSLSTADCSWAAPLQVDMAAPGAVPSVKYRKDYKPTPYLLDKVPLSSVRAALAGQIRRLEDSRSHPGMLTCTLSLTTALPYQPEAVVTKFFFADHLSTLLGDFVGPYPMSCMISTASISLKWPQRNRVAQVTLTFVLDEETSKVRSVLNFLPNYEGGTPPEVFLNGDY